MLDWFGANFKVGYIFLMIYNLHIQLNQVRFDHNWYIYLRLEELLLWNLLHIHGTYKCNLYFV